MGGVARVAIRAAPRLGAAPMRRAVRQEREVVAAEG
jgi:hypothetical protein